MYSTSNLLSLALSFNLSMVCAIYLCACIYLYICRLLIVLCVQTVIDVWVNNMRWRKISFEFVFIIATTEKIVSKKCIENESNLQIVTDLNEKERIWLLCQHCRKNDLNKQKTASRSGSDCDTSNVPIVSYLKKYVYINLMNVPFFLLSNTKVIARQCPFVDSFFCIVIKEEYCKLW